MGGEGRERKARPRFMLHIKSLDAQTLCSAFWLLGTSNSCSPGGCCSTVIPERRQEGLGFKLLI